MRKEKLIAVTSDDYGRVKLPKNAKEVLGIKENKFQVDLILGDKYILLREHQEELFDACKIMEEVYALLEKVENCRCLSSRIENMMMDTLKDINREIDEYLTFDEDKGITDCIKNITGGEIGESDAIDERSKKCLD